MTAQKKPLRAAIYTRVSEIRTGEESSISSQERSCRAFAEARGWRIEKVFTDAGISAFSGKDRPGWMSLERAVQSGEVDAVIVFAISRAARNTLRLLEFTELCKERGIPFESVSEPIGGEYGGVLLAVLGSLAQLESEMKRARARLKREQLNRDGLWGGGPRPFGYRPVQTTPDGYAKNTRLEVDPAEANWIRRGVTDVLNGVTLATIARGWNAAGITTPVGNAWDPGDVRRVLLRPNDGIVSHADHVRVGAILNEPSRGTPHGDRYLLTGLLECGVCGGRMNGRPQKGTARYICKATSTVHLAVKASLVEEAVCRAADSRFVPTPRIADDPAVELIAERDRIIRDMEALGESDLPEAVLRGRARKLQRDLEQIETELTSAAPATGSWSDLWSEISAASASDDEFYSDPATRAWLETLVETIRIRPATKPGSRWDPNRVEVVWKSGVEERVVSALREAAESVSA